MIFKFDRPVYWPLAAFVIYVIVETAALAEETSPIRVACLGDSITAGARVDAKSESYPARLQNILGDNFEVRNSGIGAATLIKTGRPNIWSNLDAVKQFAKTVGAPDALITDAAKAETSKAMRQFCNEIGTTLRVLEEGTPWANKAELYIGIIKEAVRKDMKDSNCPLAFWDYCVERRARINNLTAKDIFKLHGWNAHTFLTGEEGDILNLCQFAWYDWCYFRDHGAAFPFEREVLGQILGPPKGEGNEMA